MEMKPNRPMKPLRPVLDRCFGQQKIRGYQTIGDPAKKLNAVAEAIVTVDLYITMNTVHQLN